MRDDDDGDDLFGVRDKQIPPAVLRLRRRTLFRNVITVRTCVCCVCVYVCVCVHARACVG